MLHREGELRRRSTSFTPFKREKATIPSTTSAALKKKSKPFLLQGQTEVEEQDGKWRSGFREVEKHREKVRAQPLFRQQSPALEAHITLLQVYIRLRPSLHILLQ